MRLESIWISVLVAALGMQGCRKDTNSDEDSPEVAGEMPAFLTQLQLGDRTFDLEPDPKVADLDLRARMMPPIRLRLVDRLTKLTAHALERNKIPFWAEGGTLIGMQRFRGILPWDDDVDFGVSYAALTKNLAPLESQLAQADIELLTRGCVSKDNGQCWVAFTRKGLGREVRQLFPDATEADVDAAYRYYNKGPTIDLFSLNITDERVSYVGLWQEQFEDRGGSPEGFRAKDIFPLDRDLTFEGVPLPTPRVREAYYKVWYGDNDIDRRYVPANHLGQPPLVIENIDERPEAKEFFEAYRSFVFDDREGEAEK